MFESIEHRIYVLVKEQFEKMKMSKIESNQAKLSNTCQNIVYENWGMSSNKMWKLIDQYVEEFIPIEND